MSQGDVEARFVADTSGFQASVVQAANLTDAQMKRIAQYINAANDATARLEKGARQMGLAAGSGYEAAANAAKRLEGAHAGVNRELLVLAHELSQGNFSRFGGSMLVLAERTNALSFAMTGAGAATLGIAGVIVGAAALMAEGAIQADKFAKSLQLTGNYAAVGEGQLKALAEAQAMVTGQTKGSARSSLEAAAGSGLFGAGDVVAAARAMGDYQRVTGETADVALKNFSSIQDGVAKWAVEQNRSVHFLTAAEYDRIKALEESGAKEQAASAALTDYANAIESRAAPALGGLARAWNAVKDAASAAGQAIMDVGRPSTTQGQLDALNARLGDLTKPGPRGTAPDMTESLGRGLTRGDRVASVQRQIAALQTQAAQEQAARDAQARNASIQQAAIEADKYTDSILRGAHAISQRTAELKKWDGAVAAKAAAGTPLNASDIAAGRAEIMKRYQDHPAQEQANEVASLMATIKAFNTTTDEEVARMGKLTDAQRFSISAHEELAKAGKKLTDQQRAVVSAAIEQAAAHRAVADAALQAQKATIAQVQAATANAQVQQGLVETVIAAGNDQANAIVRQVGLIGKSADELLRIQEFQKLDDVIGKALLGADNDTVKRIQEVSRALHEDLGAAFDQSKAAQDAFNGSFSNGFMAAMDEYVKSAKDHAAAGAKFFTDAVGGMTDSLAKFAETGKLSFKGLFQALADDLIRMEIKDGLSGLMQSAKSMFGSSGGAPGLVSGLGFLGSIGGGASAAFSGGSMGSLADLFSGSFGGKFFANGLNYVPYDNFPTYLHEGEKVLSKQDARMQRSDGAMHFDFSGQTFNTGQGVSRAELFGAVQQARQETVAHIMRLAKTGKLVAA